MPVTRSFSRSQAATVPVEPPSTALPSVPAPNKRKRKAPSTATKTADKAVNNVSDSTSRKKPRVNNKKQPAKDAEAPPASETALTPILKHVKSTGDTSQTFVPAELTFSFKDAKRHLVSVDGRFEDIFAKLQCKPFENLERVHPFRALTQSILGQQISWLAARSINYKFVRLFDSSLSEIPDYSIIKSSTSFFPTPAQVAAQDIATLKTAGLSTRKAEYVQDLAARFADGRLSTERLLEADDEELAEMLIEVRGIGRWTVDMFAIFSLRRPNILPVGDLGVQRGLLRWVLALHSPAHSFSVSPDKTSLDKRDSQSEASVDEDDEPLNVNAKGQTGLTGTPAAPSSFLPAPTSATPLASMSSMPIMPTPFTPSINKTLHDVRKAGAAIPPLPEGLTVASLKGRLTGKKVKGALLTPGEMEQLTEKWEPYRSLGVYFMWALQDASKDGA
ncbi:DNA glycosylase [Coniophora puteana RWD-64-598 SS2]|uniref:DNA glycosylase n=1 Tax=Coniophora puteana (strain RWD-64-598) TaxID=741705 RepID=A0A5M3MVE5_CONPW|nr:DNA glycosylase [Coniophora puteana RWD-64-598 SS2]EIW83020.1 DNA glycosylase [Coniophora puteana RWD-64-598 SS2]